MHASFTLEELAKITGSELIGNKDTRISGVSDLETAQPHDASFLSNPRYLDALETSHAGVVFVTTVNRASPNKNLLINPDPSRAFQIVIELLLKDKEESTG